MTSEIPTSKPSCTWCEPGRIGGSDFLPQQRLAWRALLSRTVCVIRSAISTLEIPSNCPYRSTATGSRCRSRIQPPMRTAQRANFTSAGSSDGARSAMRRRKNGAGFAEIPSGEDVTEGSVLTRRGSAGEAVFVVLRMSMSSAARAHSSSARDTGAAAVASHRKNGPSSSRR